MNTGKTLQIKSTSSEDTERVGEQIGRQLRGGEIIQLTSDVGGGKTTFVRGLVRGAGSKDHVSSPSFTISNRYDTPSFAVFHYDFYRLNDAGLIQYELTDAIGASDVICVIEWADIVANVLPKDTLVVSITAQNESSRLLGLRASDNHVHLLEQLP